MASVEMEAYLALLLEQRRRAPREDLLSRCAAAEPGEGRLTVEAILGLVQILLVAATETTTNLVNDTCSAYSNTPSNWRACGRARTSCRRRIEEVLRYRSPVQWLFRAMRRDVELNGEVIRAGNLVLPVVGSANRDPRQFHQPDRFDIRREPNPHLGFGIGIHACFGAALGRLEARVALAELLARMSDFALAEDEPWEPRAPLHVHGPCRLPIRFAPNRSGPAA